MYIYVIYPALITDVLYVHKYTFLLSSDLNVEGAILVSKSRLFQRLAPRYAKDFLPLSVLIRGIAKSAALCTHSLEYCSDSLANRSLIT